MCAIDHIASMVAYWLKASQGNSDGSDFKAKRWDLSGAYACLAVFCLETSMASIAALSARRVGNGIFESLSGHLGSGKPLAEADLVNLLGWLAQPV